MTDNTQREAFLNKAMEYIIASVELGAEAKCLSDLTVLLATMLAIVSAPTRDPMSALLDGLDVATKGLRSHAANELTRFVEECHGCNEATIGERKMIKPNDIDALKMGPIREASPIENGCWSIKVTPPSWSGFKPSSPIVLSGSQYAQYEKWLRGELTMKEALPELPPSTREVLMSGIDDDQWEEVYSEEDYD